MEKRARERILELNFWIYVYMYVVFAREFVIVKNTRSICLLDLTVNFGVKTKAKLTIFSCVGRAKLVFRAVCTK